MSLVSQISRILSGRRGSSKRQPEPMWRLPVDTIGPRRHLIDMAMYNVQICARTHRENNYDGSASSVGDYMEFGVFRGDTFSYAFHRGRQLNPGMRFFAFDSFKGLPPIKGPDAGGEFCEGQFACSRSEFEDNLRHNQVDVANIHVAEGWFDEILSDQLKRDHDIRTVAIAYIDCDLYTSCVSVLEFLTSLVRQGTVLLFDDWYCFHADPCRGVQRATAEWLVANPQLAICPWMPFSHHGQSFLVIKRNGEELPESRGWISDAIV